MLRKSRSKPSVEFFPVDVDIKTLIVALKIMIHVNGTDTEQLRACKNITREAHSEPGQDILRIRSEKPSAALLKPRRIRTIQISFINEQNTISWIKKMG